MFSHAKSTLRRMLPKNAFARGVGILVGGTAGLQLLSLLTAPIYTRLYTPNDFGLLAVFTSLIALVAVIASLRYELAIPLPADDQEAANIVVLALLIVGGMAGVTLVVIAFLRQPIAAALDVPQLADYLWLLPIGILLGGAYNVFNYWAVRTKNFTGITTTRIHQALVSIALKLAGYQAGAVMLLLAHVTSQSVGATALGRAALKHPGFRGVRWCEITRVAGRYRRFPLFSTWEGLFNTAGMQLPPLMFAGLFSPAAAGLYSLANSVLSLPMSLIGGAIGQVFFANAAEAYRTGKLGPLIAQLHDKLAHIGMPPALVLMLLGPDLFGFVFGPQWRQAGEFARWMAPWLYLVFVASPISTLFAVMERQKQGLAFQVILLVARITAILIGAWQQNLELTIVLFAGVSALCWLGFLFWVARLAGNPVMTMIKPTLSAFGIAILCAAPIMAGYLVDAVGPQSWALILLLTALLVSARYWQLLRQAY